MSVWKQWVRQPQRLWIRRALFQVHLWAGIGLGLYIMAVSLTGSVLVYRNELYRAATRDPIIVSPAGPRLTPEALTQAAIRAHPGFVVDRVFEVKNPNQAVIVSLMRGDDKRERLFDPYSGRDLGNSVEWGIRVMSWLLDLHDNLLFARTGRLVNGAGALCLILVACTGMVIWWPGIQTWRRSLMLHRRVSWPRFNWDLHSALGFWAVGFVLLFAFTGAYLSYPDPFQAVLDAVRAADRRQSRDPRRRFDHVLARVPALRPVRRPAARLRPRRAVRLDAQSGVGDVRSRARRNVRDRRHDVVEPRSLQTRSGEQTEGQGPWLVSG